MTSLTVSVSLCSVSSMKLISPNRGYPRDLAKRLAQSKSKGYYIMTAVFWFKLFFLTHDSNLLFWRVTIFLIKVREPDPSLLEICVNFRRKVHAFLIIAVKIVSAINQGVYKPDPISFWRLRLRFVNFRKKSSYFSHYSCDKYIRYESYFLKLLNNASISNYKHVDVIKVYNTTQSTFSALYWDFVDSRGKLRTHLFLITSALQNTGPGKTFIQIT